MASSRKTGSNENVATGGYDASDIYDYNFHPTYGDVVSDWEVATDNDLVTTTQSEVLEVYSSGTLYNPGAVSFTGATTDASYFRIIRPASGERHNGTPDTGVRWYAGAPSGARNSCGTAEPYCQFQDIVFIEPPSSTGTGTAQYVFINMVPIGNHAAVVGCIFQDFDREWATIQTDINNSGQKLYIINCIFMDHTDGSAITQRDLAPHYAYNCTADDITDFGIWDNGPGAMYATNFVATNCGSGGFSAGVTQTNCSTSATYVDADNDDLHLDESDTSCRGNGSDLSADGTYAFDDDIDGETRSAWDIGADEYSSATTLGSLVGGGLVSKGGLIGGRLT